MHILSHTTGRQRVALLIILAATLLAATAYVWRIADQKSKAKKVQEQIAAEQKQSTSGTWSTGRHTLTVSPPAGWTVASNIEADSLTLITTTSLLATGKVDITIYDPIVGEPTSELPVGSETATLWTELENTSYDGETQYENHSFAARLPLEGQVLAIQIDMRSLVTEEARAEYAKLFDALKQMFKDATVN